MVKSKTIVRRIPNELDKSLLEIKVKNKLSGKGVIESGRLVADILNGLKNKKKIVHNIRREIDW